ncbi:HD-GYP domain, c-di-GMP phosphodiesterase class II (or its inactivated variant) [Alteromonadaceae bacterium Bs31]|nr:HD-GYP domain, c-di-GMP phosphodiesterase class II (or its inactivated variant) [Alteromonadaceae bacterium Bs31]
MIELEEQQIPVGQLKLGMYVSRLDVAWEVTNFPLQGLLIRSQADIDRLQNCSRTVFIDRSRTSLSPNIPTLARAKTAREKTIKASTPKVAPKWKRHCVERYQVQNSCEKEMKKCLEMFDIVERQIYLICEDTLHCKRANIEAISESAAQIVESVIRNPDAFAWLCRIRSSRKSIYMHTIRLAVWGAIVGRQLGLNRITLGQLCTALLVTGIGKSRIGESALAGYSVRRCSAAYKKHLDETIYQLEQFRISEVEVLNTVKSYCERIDGSGYPNRSRGVKIPFLARICGLIETFELLVNPYDVSRALSPANAIVYLNKCKDDLFEESLVEEFIKAIGIYPTGTLVELNDGQLGVIFSQDYEKRLRAKVIPILDANGNIKQKYKILDLAYARTHDPIFISKGVPATSIPRGLLENAHNWMFKRNSKIKTLFGGIL